MLTEWSVQAQYLPLRVVRVRVPRDSLFICGFGRNDQGGKKLPRLPHIQSTGLWPAYLTELRCRCVWVGQGFGGFLDLRGKIFFLSRNTRGCLATADRVFLYFFYPWNLHGQYRLNFYSPNSNNDHLNQSFWSV